MLSKKDISTRKKLNSKISNQIQQDLKHTTKQNLIDASMNPPTKTLHRVLTWSEEMGMNLKINNYQESNEVHANKPEVPQESKSTLGFVVWSNGRSLRLTVASALVLILEGD